MEPIVSIVNALIEKGDIWSAIALVLFFLNIHKEKSQNDPPEKEKPKKIQIKNTDKEVLEKLENREKELLKKIQELEKSIVFQQEEIKKLEKDLVDCEKDRIEDLKQLLSEYHSTASDTLKALEKFEFFITNSKGGKS